MRNKRSDIDNISKQTKIYTFKNIKSSCYYRSYRAFLVLLLAVYAGSLINPVYGQGLSDYYMEARPDLWYNKVDGIRVGGLIQGQQYPTSKVAPHQVTLGIWIGTKWPNHPVSYYVDWREPLTDASLERQAYIKTRSSIRTGFHHHQFSVFKRWKAEEKNRFFELEIGLKAIQRFDNRYLLYPQLWQNKWLSPTTLNGRAQLPAGAGVFRIEADTWINIPIDYEPFMRSKVEVLYDIPIGKYFSFHSRLFAGIATGQTPLELQWLRSVPSPYSWTEKGIFRAKGTIPSPWMLNAYVHPVGGPNLRGYYKQDVIHLTQNITPLYNSFGAVNTEIVFPNPLSQALKRISVVREFAKLSTYMFFDAGSSTGWYKEENEKMKIHADAGTGIELSVNIPDYRNKDRGFFLRYDIPFWLSNPSSDEAALSLRHIIGIGTVFTL